MADGTVGQQYTERFRTSAVGESFTISAATYPDGSAWAGPTITDLGSGTYRLSFTPDVEGVWEATLTGDTSGEVLVGEWDIAAATDTTTDPAAVDGVRGTTLQELINRVAFRLGDHVLLEASDTGTTTTFVDTLNIPMGNEDLTRRQLVFLSGTYQGEVKVIQDTAAAAHAITFYPALSGNVPAGTTAMVINKRGMGYTYLEYKRAINMAIDDAYPIYREAVVLDVPVLDGDFPAIDLGSSRINEVYDVQWQDDDGSWWPLAQAVHVGYPGWQVERYSNQIIINDYDLRRDLYGVTIRVLGEGRPSSLSTFSDRTLIHPEWLTARACYHLCLMGLDRDITGLRSKQVLTFQAEAEQRMTLIRTRREPASRMTRSS